MIRSLPDLRVALRRLVRSPSATITVLIALSLGIGLSSLTFSLIRGAVLPTLPHADADRIVRIDRVGETPMSIQEFEHLEARQRSFDAFGAAEVATVTLAIEGAGAEPVSAAAITPAILPLLSTQPALGRPFTDADAAEGAPAVVLVGDAVWRTRLGADPGVLGTVVRLDGQPAQVVGVMPEGFGFPFDQQVWSPLSIEAAASPDPDFTANLESGWVVGMLREGVSREAAEVELNGFIRELDTPEADGTRTESSVRIVAYTDLFSQPGASAALATLMLGVALLVLLVACSNVANVLLARAIDRRRDVAIRQAIGASRLRIVAEHLAELLLLATAGAVGGVLVTMAGTRFVDLVMPPGMPYWIDLRLDAIGLLFIALASVLAAVAAGLMPTLQASRANTSELLKDSSRTSSSYSLGRVMRRLIGVEIAFSFVLLVLAGLFIRSAANFSATDFAFAPEGVYTGRIRLSEAEAADPAARARLAESLLRSLDEVPQVDRAVLANAAPGVGPTPTMRFEAEGTVIVEGIGGPLSYSTVVTPGYFELFHGAFVAGRDFDSRDGADALPVAIVNEPFAQRYFPGGAIDRRIRRIGPDGPEEWVTIVGVSSDLVAGAIDRDIEEIVYRPLAQDPQQRLMILARPRGEFATVAAPIREAVEALDPDLALFSVQPLDAMIAAANSQYTWFSLLFAIAGGVALFLAAIGLYGVMSFWVVQRTREIGVRMALGGVRRDVVRLVIRQGMRQISIGLIAGVLMAIPAAWTLRAALFGVAPYDPVVFTGILAVLIGAAALGCWIPASRATRMDPLEALAAE